MVCVVCVESEVMVREDSLCGVCHGWRVKS